MPNLICIYGPDEGKMIPLGNANVVIGRDEGLKVQLNDPKLSRKHFRVSRAGDAGNHVLEDLGSKNGTLLNGNPVTQPTDMKAGDRIGVGDTGLVYLVDEHRDAESALTAAKQLGQRGVPTLVEDE
ncbi:MAG: FHA domain-containing protein [Planctomycetota bacterium]